MAGKDPGPDEIWPEAKNKSPVRPSLQEVAEARMRNAGEGGEGDEIPELIARDRAEYDTDVGGDKEGNENNEIAISGDSVAILKGRKKEGNAKSA